MNTHSLLCFILPVFLYSSCKNKPGQNQGQEPTSGTTLAKPLAPSQASPLVDTDIYDAGIFVLPDAPKLLGAPLGLPTIPSPDYNPTTADKAALGKLLFFEKALSSSGQISCASCHQPENAWASPSTRDATANQIPNKRHTPTLLNLAYHTQYYWDGRAEPLEAQILGHWTGQLGSRPDDTLRKLSEQKKYNAHFLRAFNTAPVPDRAAEAIAAFIRTIQSGNSPWDRYEAGDQSAVSQNVIAGAKIFNQRAGCATCHTPPLYTDLLYHDVGVPRAKQNPDLGRSTHALQGARFKTPTLRDILRSAPYFHNGGAATLDQVLAIKEAAGAPSLNSLERRQLLAFLAALSSDRE